MLNILLLGVVHEYQWQDPQFLYNPKEKVEVYLGQLRSYAHWVREKINSFQPELIFDEMNLPESEPYNRLQDMRIPWVYMDIPEHVRAEFNLKGDRGKPGNTIIPEIDEARERHWLKMIDSISNECKLSRVAVLCGAAHLPTFRQKLTDAKHTVVDSLDCRQCRDWYSTAYIHKLYPE